MSSSDFKRVLIRDERLDAKDSLPFAVYKSGQNVTVAEFNAISATSSSHTYNIQVPSETTIIDRRVIWESVCTFKVTLPTSATAYAGQNMLQYGKTEALGPFPLHSLCSTMQVTINNNSVSTNMNDILPALLHFHDRRELNRYNGMSPILPDKYRNYSQGADSNNNDLGDYSSQSLDNDFDGRGAFSEVSFSGSGGSASPQSSYNAAVPVGKIDPNAAYNYYFVQFKVREPLLVSPFSYAHPYVNGQGFYGIQNLNFVFNLISDQKSGVWRSASQFADGLVISDMQFSTGTSKLIFNFLSPKPSDMLSARNVVPYWEMPRYLTTGFSTLAAATRNANGSIIPATASFTSNTIQLNQIPDKLIIFLRRQKSARTCATTDSSLFISRITVNFNNQSGILASATTDQLYRFTNEAGSNQSWAEYKALANITQNTVEEGVATPLVGSYLMLDMGRHIQITEDYYAPGSLGNFNLNFTIEVNNTDADNTYPNAELVLITLNSGIFVCEKGQSATYTGILTKDDVLSVSGSEAVNEREAARMVGGAFSLSALKPLALAAAPMAIEKASKVAAEKFGPSAGKIVGALGEMGLQKFAGQGRMKGCGKGAGQYNAISDRLV